MIYCTRCKTEKTLDGFYKSRIKHNNRGTCKTCLKEVDSNWRKSWSEERRKAEEKKRLDYYRHPDRVAYHAAYRKTDRYLETQKQGVKRYRQSNKGIQKAHQAVKNALKSGALVRPDSCETCAKKADLDAHHCNYNHPLNVMWLCRPCHAQWHVDNTPIYAKKRN